MQLRIFNVGHGSCALLIADNRNVVLFDCGHDADIGFWPSQYLSQFCNAIEHVVISHYDEDLLSDFAALRASLLIRVLHRNTSITPEQIRWLKLQSGPLTPGVSALLDMLGTYRPPTFIPQLAGMDVRMFWNSYPALQDTNNLSLVSFIHYGPLSILLPGDLEKAGWRALLTDPAFRDDLRRVTIFVAAHHGRENGYLPEVFDYCAPQIVIISDTAIQYDTQVNAYAQHATGLRMDDGSTRRVFTTRGDGNIVIESRGQGYRLTAMRQLP